MYIYYIIIYLYYIYIYISLSHLIEKSNNFFLNVWTRKTLKDTADFLEKIKSLGRIPDDAFLVAADIVGLYPSIPHHAGLKAL